MSKFLSLHMSRSINNHTIFLIYKTTAHSVCPPSPPLCPGQRLTFDADVAVSLEVVVGSFPGVAVMTQQCDRWPGTHRDVPHTFLIYKTSTTALPLRRGRTTPAADQ